MRPELVIFDCDGVIVDSEAPMLSMLFDEFTAMGATLEFDSFHRASLGSTVPNIAQTMRDAGLPLPLDYADQFYERLYVTLGRHTPLIDGIGAVFDRLDAAAMPYVVGSNGRGRKMGITLGQHVTLWNRLKHVIYSGQDLGMTKPAPDLYLHIARTHRVRPDHCAVIEDSPTGAIAARRAGMPCFGFADGERGTSLAAEGAHIFSTMSELPALLGV